MFFAISKFAFEPTGKPATGDRKELHSLVEKIRSRFKVSCAVVSEEDETGTTSIAVAALSSSETGLDQMLDQIAEFCESAGFGRIESEQTLLDHVEALDDYVEEEE